MDIEQARAEIAEVDREMAVLFERRMSAAAEIARYKSARGLPIRDKAQEEKVLLRNARHIEDLDKRGLYLNFIRDVMRYARQYEHRIIKGDQVAYCGVEGAFAHIAASRIFPASQLIPYSSFEEAYRSVERGDCTSAVLPIENSYAGEVGQVMDLMFEGALYVNGIYDLAVDHCLLGTRDASAGQIRTVISHPQALDQCHVYISRNGIVARAASNTAVAAKTVAEGKDPSVAAIASEETAALYGLKVLERRINESRTNTTRFAVFSQVRAELHGAGVAFLLLFTVSDEAGGLARAINVISDHHFNMRVLRSRPMKSLPWHYYFYTEVEGDASSENGVRLLEDLRQACTSLRVVGHYTAGTDTQQGGETI